MKKIAQAILISLALLIILAANAQAATITQTFSVPSRSTDWSQIWSAAQFNSDLGCLQKVTLELDGRLSGTVRGESLDYSASTYAYGIAASLVAYKGTTPLAGALASLGHTDTLLPFDGLIDFGGLSGFTHTYSDSLVGSTTLTTGLEDFIGSGIIPLVWTTNAHFEGNGPGNIIWHILTQAGVTAQLTYDYADCPPTHAPEPTTGLLLLTGLLAIWGVRKIKYKSGDKS